jgi:hypothetical protein
MVKVLPLPVCPSTGEEQYQRGGARGRGREEDLTCKDCCTTAFENEFGEWLDGVHVDVVRGVVLAEDVIHSEESVVQILRDAIHLQLAVMDHNGRVRASDSIMIFLLNLFAVHWTLADADTDLHIARWGVRLLGHYILFAIFSDHFLKVNVSEISIGAISSLLCCSLIFLLFHIPSSLISLSLKLLDLRETILFPRTATAACCCSHSLATLGHTATVPRAELREA